MAERRRKAREHDESCPHLSAASWHLAILTLEEALDLGWGILSDCFQKDETGIKSALIDEFWPEK